MMNRVFVFAVLLGLLSHPAFAQNSQTPLPTGVVLNEYFAVAPNGAGQWYNVLIASLAPSSAGSYDHIHVLATLNTGDTAAQNSFLDANFGNRNGFQYTWSLRGSGNTTAYQSRLMACPDSTDGSVDIYLVLGDAYAIGGYTIVESDQESVYTNPTLPASQSSLPCDPATQALFDSSYGKFGAATYTDYSGNLSINGNVGIGTTSPSATLDVNGGIKIRGSQGLTFPDGSTLTVANGALRTSVPGATGNGVPSYIQTSPSGSGGSPGTIPVFTGNSNIANSLVTQGNGFIQVSGEVISSGPGAGFRVLSTAGDDVNDAPWYGVGQSDLNLNQGGANAVQVAGYFGLDFETGHGTVVIRGDSGYIGLNTTTPEEMLEVNGNIKLTANTGGHVVFPDNTVQSTAWNGVLYGGDYAESVNVSGDREKYEPGDVLVIDPNSEGHFINSSTPYSAAVSGIYSTKPGVVGRRQKTARAHMTEEVPMAMTGIVPTKVSAENGPIKPGDLLVTSSKAGYAMKGTDRSQMLGAVIGKAIGHLDSATGVIETVVTLQ